MNVIFMKITNAIFVSVQIKIQNLHLYHTPFHYLLPKTRKKSSNAKDVKFQLIPNQNAVAKTINYVIIVIQFIQNKIVVFVTKI